MDHAQEVAIWKAIGELERDVSDMQETFEMLQKETIAKPRALFRVGVAFFVGMLVMAFLGSDLRGKPRSVILDVAYEIVR